jgi:hypothetical protein
MQFHRFMRANDFVQELASLRAFRGEYMGSGLLEDLAAAGLLHPRVRIRYPDAIARRFWLATHDHLQRQLRLPLEADGKRWDAAVDLDRALLRWQSYHAYGLSPHPLDNPEPRFAEFIQLPKNLPFERRIDRRVDVSGDAYETLFDDCNIEDYYNSWQILFAAEVADAGVHMRINLADKEISRSAHEALSAGRIPEGTPYSFNLMPIHAARDFARHEKALDAVVWFAEECSRALSMIAVQHGGGRFRLNPSEGALYERTAQDLAKASLGHFDVKGDELVELIRFLAEYWSKWDRDGRPHIADAYKEFLAQTVLLARRVESLTFTDLRDRVGKVDGRFKPILDVVWPNWSDGEMERTRLVLKTAMKSKKSAGISVSDIDIEAFVNFLATEGLEAFFWRLNSFENHALRGNEFALEGMKSDVQGMSIAVEHIAGALGGTETQLYEKFKQLWHEPGVLEILKRGDVAPLARMSRLAEDWPALKDKINALRAEPGGEVAADLVMAHRIRGGVHAALPEDDHFALEEIFVGLMRAALHTFVEVRWARQTEGRTGA